MKAAVIGLGRIGFEFSLDSKRRQPASHLGCYAAMKPPLAFCDVDSSKLAAASDFLSRQQGYASEFDRMDNFGGGYKNYHEMLQAFKPEIVSICTPTLTHAGITCDVASYPFVKAIFLEKPIAQSLEEANLIIEACKKHNVQLAVNYTRRWETLWNMVQAHGLVNPDDKIHNMVGIHPGPLLRTGTHMLDLFNWFMDVWDLTPTWVQAFGKAHSNHIADGVKYNDFNISGVIGYSNGVEAMLISGHQPPYLLFELDVLRSLTRTRIVENGGHFFHWTSEASDRYSNLKELKACHIIFARSLPESHTPIESAILELMQSTVDDGVHPSCTGEDARKALAVALALHYSSQHKGKAVNLVHLPETYTVRSY